MTAVLATMTSIVLIALCLVAIVQTLRGSASKILDALAGDFLVEKETRTVQVRRYRRVTVPVSRGLSRLRAAA